MKDTKRPCNYCGVAILHQTFQKNDGACATCAKFNKSLEVCAGSEFAKQRFEFEFKIQLTFPYSKRSSTNKDLSMYLTMITNGENAVVAERRAIPIIERKAISLFGTEQSKVICSTHFRTKLSSTGAYTKFTDINKGSFKSLPTKENQTQAIKPNLEEIEKTLFDLSVRSIDEFFKSQNQKFYAFGFDCNALYGQVLLCANTLADFAITSSRYIERWNYSDSELNDLKRNFGDWKYQGFNLDQSFWEEGWGTISKNIETYLFDISTSEDDGDLYIEQLLESFSKVLIRLEEVGRLNVIKKETSFYIQIYDHDENPEDGDIRMKSVQQLLGKT